MPAPLNTSTAKPALFLLAALLGASMSLQAADWQYVTVPGDTLIGIGQQYLKNPKDWPKVQSENKVEIPKKMPANFRLRIPVHLLKVTPAPVDVTAVSGNVRVKGAEKDAEKGTPSRFQPLKAGSQLNGGETVVTGPGSSASYRFADGTTLTQQAASRLGFGRLAAYGKTGMISTELSLEAGRLEAQAAKQQFPAGGFKVRTPVAVAGLRGTAFRINVAEDGSRMSNEVTEGIVAVAGKGKAVDVQAGFGTLTEKGKAPITPRELLPAPSVSAMPALFQTWPLRFDKPKQAGAVAWRARIAPEGGFQSVLLDQIFTGQTAQWDSTLPDGTYYLRARAIDADGLEGLESTHAFTVDVHPLPPQAVAPALGERLYQAEARLTWSTVPDAQGYLLQLAPTPDFQQGVIERRLGPVVQHSETLTEGEWHWRLASLDEQGQPHLFGPHRAFVVKPLPAAPGGGQSQVDEGKAHFSWQPVKGADRYGLEISQNQKLVASKTAATATISAELEPGKYHWRVQGQEADGQGGGWSQPGVVILPPPAPTNVKVERQTTPTKLSWQGQGERYRVEVVAKTAGSETMFAKPAVSVETSALSIELKDLPAGDYRGRVIALGTEGAASAPSPGVDFQIARPTPWWLMLCLLPAL